MTRSDGPTNTRKPSVFCAGIAGYLIIGWLLDRAFGHQAVTVAYQSGLKALVDALVPGKTFDELSIYLSQADQSFLHLWTALLLALVMIGTAVRPDWVGNWTPLRSLLDRHAKSVDSIQEQQVEGYIAFAAGLGLFLELMVIRLHSSYFQLFAYFKNISLLSCFLGLGIGYATSGRRSPDTPLVLPLFVLQATFLYLLRHTPVGLFLQNPIAEAFTMGSGVATGIVRVAMVHAFLLMVFAFNSICFISVGNLAGRLMARRDNLSAYGWNLLGSLAGILLFSLLSYLWTPPAVWMLVAGLGLIWLMRREAVACVLSAGSLLLLGVVLSLPFNVDEYDVYSPYQILTLVLSRDQPPMIEASNTYYQRIMDLRESPVGSAFHTWANYYRLPYAFRPSAPDVLVVGSGTGNDVAGALRSGAGRVDAVEIDPAIIEFGRRLHPESPYQALNVRVFADDARAFIRRTDRRYDVVVYGLLDSHTLLSGLSGGLRLDSYVYTVEGLRSARQLLKPDGVLCLTFAILGPQLGRKLYLMLEDAFAGQSPVVYRIGRTGAYAFVAGRGFLESAQALPADFVDVTSTFADKTMAADKSTDDWPFFYMPVRTYPWTYVVVVVAVLLASVFYIWRFFPASGGTFSGTCCLLGAGFMLVETKGITELALLFGSTWIVTGIVVASILIMAFLANWFVITRGTVPSAATYGLLLLSLGLGFAWTFVDLGRLSPWVAALIGPAVLTLPLFFSGIAFSAELKKTFPVGAALSSNLLGAIVGGLVEYNSMYFGFRSLYVFAFALYSFAFYSATRK